MNKILVGIDLLEKDRSVIDTAISLAQTTGATLMLLHVLSRTELDYPILPTYSYNPILDEREYRIYQQQLAGYYQRGIDQLQKFTKEAIAKSVKAEYTQLTGNPGRMICELATNWSAELIVVGSRGLKGLKEIFLGSVSNYVTHHSPCSVLIVRTATSSGSDDNSANTTTSEAEFLTSQF